MQLSYLKPKHALRKIEVINAISSNQLMIRQCWEKVGIISMHALPVVYTVPPLVGSKPSVADQNMGSTSDLDIDVLARRMLGKHSS